MIFSGSEIANKIKTEVLQKTKNLQTKPKLAVILVGQDPASSIYVEKKQKACKECGIESTVYNINENSTTDDLIHLIMKLNHDNRVHGILIQLPLPNHVDKFKVLQHILPEKDVDCFTPTNIGLLSQNNEKLAPCTPSAIIEIFKNTSVNLEGKNVVIINDSIVVGRPLAMMLLNRGATPTICNKHTLDLKNICLKADIIVVAVGNRKEFALTKDFCKKNVVLIDVGISKIDNRIIGDVDLESVLDTASFVTKTPGGVGLITVAMLIKNTLIAFEMQNK